MVIPSNLTQCTFDPPSASISANPSTIIEGQSTTLSWSTSGDVDSVSITNIGGVGTGGSISVSPNSTTTYTVTASNVAYNRSDSITVTVFQRPTVNLSLDNNSIVYGESTTLMRTARAVNARVARSVKCHLHHRMHRLRH